MQQLSSINKKFIIIIYCFIYKFTITDVINHPKPINIPTIINNIKPMNIPREEDIPNANEIITIQKDTKNNTNDNHQNIQDDIYQNLKDIQNDFKNKHDVNDFNNKHDVNDVNDKHDVKDHHDVNNRTVLFLIILGLSVGTVSIISLVWLNNPETQQNNQINNPSKILTSNDQTNNPKLQEENNIILKPALEKALQKASQKNNAFNEIMEKLNDTDQLIKPNGTSIKDQIENLSTLRLEELKPKEIQAFDENIQYINSDALNETNFFIPYVHVDHIKNFTEKQIKAFNKNILDQFNKEQVQAFDKNIKDIDLQELIESPQFISFLSTKQIKEYLTKDQIENFSFRILNEFKEEQVQAFGDNIKDIDPSALSKAYKFVSYLPADYIKHFTKKQIKAFNLNILNQFNKEQVQALDYKITDIDPKKLIELSQFISFLSKKQIKEYLTEDQIKAFNSNILDKFNKEQVQDLVNIQDIDIDQLEYTENFIPYLSIDQIKNFTENQINNFNYFMLDKFNKEQVEAFDKNIKEIPIDELLKTKKFITYCSEDQINQINQNTRIRFNQKRKEVLQQIKEFSNKYSVNNIEQLTKEQIEKFDYNLLDQFNETQIKAFGNKIKDIKINQLYLTKNFIPYLPANHIQYFSNEQIQNFTTNILDQFNETQVQAFGDKIQDININKLNNTSKFIPYLSIEQINNFRKDQIKKFDKNILDQFNKEQVEAFGDKIKHIDANALNETKLFIPYLPANHIQYFSNEQIQNFKTKILNQFNKKQVEAFGNKIQDINPKALTQSFKFIMNLSLAQIKQLTDEQIQQISNTITSKLGQEEENFLREKIQLMMKNKDLFNDTNHQLCSYYSFDQIHNLTETQIKKFDNNILDQFNKEQVQAFGDNIKDIKPNELSESFQFVSFLSKKQINESLIDMQILGIRNHGDLFANLGEEQYALLTERFKNIANKK